MRNSFKSSFVPDSGVLRVYLDSNVLFSASREERSRFLEFWQLSNVTPVVSLYAFGEVMRNVRSSDHDARLARLLMRTQIVSDADVRLIPAKVALAGKDQPILAAAIAASVEYLATGDRKHFAHLYNTKVAGVRILTPGDFLNLHEDRLIG